MAFAIPSNSAIHTLLEDAARGDAGAKHRLQQIEDDGIRFDQEDYRTVSTERGPVRGYQGGARRL